MQPSFFFLFQSHDAPFSSFPACNREREQDINNPILLPLVVSRSAHIEVQGRCSADDTVQPDAEWVEGGVETKVCVEQSNHKKNQRDHLK